MGEREKIARQKASLKFPQLQGFNFGENIEFHGCIKTNFITLGSLDQEEKVLVNDSVMNNGLELMNACSF
ncbi:hypothetical protein Pfo_015855 [Paulownia fortunei]|nr:hypothetical protein Pfo_015855 [Paulownia fortunei]